MNKILDLNDLSDNIEKIKLKGSIVLVGGCFDILHTGHKKFLRKAKEQGDILIVLLESDENVRKRKGEKRPINNQAVRAQILTTLRDVDYILTLPFFQSDKDYYKLTNLIKPAIIAVTENDPFLKVKQDQAKMVGGKVVEVVKQIPNKSTSKILENIKT